MQSTPYAIPLIVAAVVCGATSIYTLRRRRGPASTPFALLMAGVAFWSLGYALEVALPTFSGKFFWAKFQYLGIATVPTLWLVFAVGYTGLLRPPGPWARAMLAVEPVVVMLLAFTSEWHNLIWADVEIDRSIGFAILRFDYGTTFWIHAAYSYVIMLLGVALIVGAALTLPRMGRRQAVVLLLAVLAPWTGNAIYLSGTDPFPFLDLTPFGFTVTGLAIAWTMRSQEFLRILPVAHRTIIDSMDDGVVALDSENRVVEVNRAAEAILGVVAARAHGLDLDRVLAHRPDLANSLHANAPGSTSYEGEVSGERRTFDVRSTPLHCYTGGPIGRLLIFHDVTDQRRAQRQLERAKQAAEAASRTKSDFLARMSHEIRTPMNAIIGMTELALDGPLSGEQREYLGLVQASADSLLRIIDDVLEVSKIKTGRLEIKAVPFDLYRVIEQAMGGLIGRAEDRRLGLETEIASTVPRYVVGDASRIYDVLSHLVGNGIKFTQEGSVRLEVVTEPVGRVPAWDDRRADVRFRVVDTGIGIAADQQARIFRDFEQADTSSTRVYGGTGLGLTIAAALVGLMGGRIELDSTVGRGSTFEFALSFRLATADEVVTDADEHSATAANSPV